MRADERHKFFPKRSSLRIPTPLTLNISLAETGICSAISINVASLKTTYGGIFSSSAIALRKLAQLSEQFAIVITAERFLHHAGFEGDDARHRKL
ncbi:Uncharacterised protein [Salmonella enterica subsp. enterica]|uniref:Uncharacterized protein n=1 Tax=Salmonella enterica I TaxID=59201 RepID=A0A3S4GUV6_SALET|nr:Uncharacterised protein [Salmonella enterica subsp. enterica]